VSIDFSRSALLTADIDLHEIALRRPSFVVERLEPETYNILKALRVEEKSPDNEAGGFSFAIERFVIDSGSVVFVDHTQDPDYEVTFSSLDVTAGPIATLLHEAMTPTCFTAGVQVAGGVVNVEGFQHIVRGYP
jgi:uncharacterized protein involved in outer membrane biogenesis